MKPRACDKTPDVPTPNPPGPPKDEPGEGTLDLDDHDMINNQHLEVR